MFLPVLPYHLKVRDHFSQQAGIWDFFAASGAREDQLISFKTELLKNTYKFDPVNDAHIYDAIGIAKEKLGLASLPVTAYQAQYPNDHDLNASIVYLHQEAHLVFSGNLIQKLTDKELLAIIAHELTHVRLYTLLDGDLEVADRIISSIANQQDREPHLSYDRPLTRASSAPYVETARLFRLYTEIFCDRGAYMVLEDTAPVINMLSKIATGLSVVHAESYSKQAEEIFSQSPDTRADTLTHPENFIRTRALRLWHEQKEAAEPAIKRMIEGIPELDRLDIFVQKELAELTREFLELYLQPSWFHSTLVESLIRQYFPDLPPGQAFFPKEPVIPAIPVIPTGLPDPTAPEQPGSSGTAIDRIMAVISAAHHSIKEYFSYLLVDFALVDPSLEEAPAGRAFRFAEDLQLSAPFASIVKKELQLSDKKLQQYKEKALTAYAEAAKNPLQKNAL